jgi:hypothetical protein
MNGLFEKVNKYFLNCYEPEKAQKFFQSGIKDLENILFEMKHCPIFINK